MKILILTGASQYGAFDSFVEDMKLDLTKIGCEVDVTLCTDTADRPDLKLSQYDKFISLNGVGLNIEASDISVRKIATPEKVWVWLLDHPLHILPRVLGLPVSMLCLDEEHVPFCQLCGLQALYFPHSISAVKLASFKTQETPSKNDNLVFPVSYFSQEEQKKRFGPLWERLQPLLSESENITDFLQYLGVLPFKGRGSVTPLNQDIFKISTIANLYLRAIGRQQLLEQCAERNLKLTLIGKGVENYRVNFPQFEFKSELTMENLNGEISKARFVLHNTPGFRRGLHDRPLNALMRGTLVITDSKYLREHFPGACLSPDDNLVLSEEDYRHRINNARALLAEKYSWEYRFAKLL